MFYAIATSLTKSVIISEPYTAREARLHVRHVRDLLKSTDQRDAYDGVDCSSLSFLSTLAGNVLGENTNSKRCFSDINVFERIHRHVFFRKQCW